MTAMDKKQLLLNRLQSIAVGIASWPDSLALLGLGSAGMDVNRLDDYSDLDFFVIVRSGTKQNYLNDLSWLERHSVIVYYFKNTEDGYKALYEDGVFLEFAVFEPDELKTIPYPPGKVIWASPECDQSLANPQIDLPQPKNVDKDWAVNEALSLLYIGLSRFLRGEKLSAFRFVQVYAVDRIIELSQFLAEENPVDPDPFVFDRRFEQRFPEFATALPGMMQGYEHTPQSALDLLKQLEAVYPVNQNLAAEIRLLAAHAVEKN